MRVLAGSLLVALLASEALPAGRTAGTWIAQVRLDVLGTEDGPDPYVRIVLSPSVGKAGVPMSQSAGMHGGTSLTMTPAEARAMGEALIAWADNPTETTIYTRTR
jgi:hypothetical protein